MIYFDNAATTALEPKVLSAMTPYYNQVFANPSSSHSMGIASHKAMDDCTSELKRLLGADTIVYTSGGSESDNQAILSAAALGRRLNKKHIVSTSIEHPAVLKYLENLDDFSVTLVNPHSDGLIYPCDIAQAITDKTVLVSVMYANNETGALMPITEIGAVCHERGVYLHTDAVQAAGKVNIDCRGQNIDLLSLSAHKFHGPRGVGLLCVTGDMPIIPFVLGGGQQSGLRAGTENLPSIVGMTRALSMSIDKLYDNTAYVSSLRAALLQGVMSLGGTHINTDLSHSLPGTLNVSFDGCDASALLELFDLKGLIASGGSACHSGCLTPSYVLTAMGLSPSAALSSVRFSLDAYNTMPEVNDAVAIIKDCINKIAYR